MEARRNIEKELEKDIQYPPKAKRRSSFFGYNSVDSVGQREKCNAKDIEIYMNKLQLEFDEWPKNYVRIKNKLLNFWSKEPDSLDDNLFVSKEQQEYLEKAVNVNEYLRDSTKLCNQIERYIMKKEWYLENYEYLIKSIQDKAIDEEIDQKTVLKYQSRDSFI
ncbi:unnamed protein product [Chironomus riparius]|uniref:Uncharacterized protein n=1 Tax=Chironomus riparius TaxID=315576 RepID=A0A9N9WKJ8_9DIPT|nr:unnamed protein product [Chironomus riparius]